MRRPITQIGQSVFEWLFTRPAQDNMVALGKLAAAVLGTTTLANGLAVSPTSPASLQVSVAPGEIYSLAALESTVYGTLAADTTHQIVKQGISLDAVLLTITPPATAGQSINYLIQATFAEQDISVDPTTGTSPVVLPFYNSSNPTQPWSGPNNSGQTSYTFRQGAVVLSAKAGIAATTGSQVTPAPDSGNIGLYVVTVANGQSTITAGNISIYPGAPFIPSAGLIVGGLQQNACISSVAGGTADALTGSFFPGISSLPAAGAGLLTLYVRPNSANATTTPTFTPNSGTITAKTIVKGNNLPLAAGDIAGAGHWIELQYDATLDKWVLLNPATGIAQSQSVVLTRSQTVLNGTADANGYAAFFTAGSGLACNLVATTPITVAFAAGYGTNGLISYIGVISASVTAAWSGLTASQTSYLYIDRNTSTGALTYGASLLAPVYQDAAPSSPATDQHWFSPLTMTMQRWSGSAWVTVQRVFVGRAIAGASSITGVTVYAFNGRYLSQPFAVAYSASSVVTHALGVQPRITLAYLVNVVSDLGYGVGNRVLMTYADNTSSVCSLSSDTLNGSFNLSSGGLALPQIGTGTRGGITTASWNVQTYFDRGW